MCIDRCITHVFQHRIDVFDLCMYKYNPMCSVQHGATKAYKCYGMAFSNWTVCRFVVWISEANYPWLSIKLHFWYKNYTF